MQAVIALGHFCENHGPRVVFTCQPMRSLPSTALSREVSYSQVGFVANYFVLFVFLSVIFHSFLNLYTISWKMLKKGNAVERVDSLYLLTIFKQFRFIYCHQFL